MTVLTLCSAKGSPGVTTLACAIAAVWPTHREVFLAECDPSGGDLAARFGMSARTGMASLVLARRQTPATRPDPSPHFQHLPGGLEVLVGPAASDSASVLDHEIANMPMDLLPSGVDIIVDCGRIVPGARGQHRMLKEADHLLLVTRTDPSSILHARCAIERLAGLGNVHAMSVVLEGDGQCSAEESKEFIGRQVEGTVPYDPRGAAAACGVPSKARQFAKSPLISSARQIVQRVFLETRADLGRPEGRMTDVATDDVASPTEICSAVEVDQSRSFGPPISDGESNQPPMRCTASIRATGD